MLQASIALARAILSIPCTSQTVDLLLSLKIEKARIAGFILFLAERRGFEPRVGYEPTHAFQACDLNHSSISPDSISLTTFSEAADYSKTLAIRGCFRAC